jgi:hypothetical protein
VTVVVSLLTITTSILEVGKLQSRTIALDDKIYRFFVIGLYDTCSFSGDTEIPIGENHEFTETPLNTFLNCPLASDTGLKPTRVHQHRDKMLKVLPGDFVEMGVLPALAKSGQKLYRRDRILVMGLDRTNLCMKNYRSVPNRWKY